MTQYKSLNVKLSDSQINELKPGIKNDTGITFHQRLLLMILISR